jgi:hypothetical protein
MPANLPPQYYNLEREFRAEKDTREKLRMAEELLRMMPKHKGTSKLQAEMKTKISNLKKLLTDAPKGGAARQAQVLDHIDKEGAGQAILIGPPNCGKSSLLDALTNAKPLIGDYPYTTREPQTGMTVFETVQLQLIDTPPLSTETFEGYLTGLIRNADLVVLVADLVSPTMIADLDFIVEQLEEKRIILRPENLDTSDDPRLVCKRTFVCAHKVYDDESGERLAALTERFAGFRIVGTSIIDDDTLLLFKKTIFEMLSIIRVYTKPVGRETDFTDPIILPSGSTVEDAAMGLHKDFAERLKFAKIWGEGKHDGQRVKADFSVIDGDIIEFHT